MKKNSSLTKYLKSRMFGKEPKNLCYSQNGNEKIITVTKTISATRKVLPRRYITNGSVYLIGRHAAVQLKDTAVFAWSPNSWTNWPMGLELVEQNYNKFSKEMIELLLLYLYLLVK